MNEIPNPASVAAPSTEALILARRLAIQILHEAQIAQPAAIHGWVYERGGQPSVFRLAAADMGTHRADENLWARLWSNPTTPAVPSPATCVRMPCGSIRSRRFPPTISAT